MTAATVAPKVAVVSGGSRGLGRIVVERLLKEGWCVATFSRTANDFVRETTAAAEDNFFWEPADINEPDTVRNFARRAEQRFGRIDLLVNNAGELSQGLLLTTPTEQLHSLIRSNLVAPMVLSQACARAMSRCGGGQIVNVSSVNAIRGYRGVAVYTAAKAGLDGFSRSLARELGPLGICVNSIVPGFFGSNMTVGVAPQVRDRILRRTPLGRLGTAEEIAEVIMFLTSPAASFITGQAIVVDGGITC